MKHEKEGVRELHKKKVKKMKKGKKGEKRGQRGKRIRKANMYAASVLTARTAVSLTYPVLIPKALKPNTKTAY